MDYCLGDGDGSAAMWSGEPVLDVDGDGELDAISLDVDGDGRFDDAMADLDHDGFADHVVFDLDDDGRAEAYFTDDGSGTWTVGAGRSGQVRWFGLDGIEHPDGTAVVDFDGDGQVDGDGFAGDGHHLRGGVADVDHEHVRRRVQVDGRQRLHR